MSMFLRGGSAFITRGGIGGMVLTMVVRRMLRRRAMRQGYSG